MDRDSEPGVVLARRRVLYSLKNLCDSETESNLYFAASRILEEMPGHQTEVSPRYGSISTRDAEWLLEDYVRAGIVLQIRISTSKDRPARNRGYRTNNDREDDILAILKEGTRNP